MLSPACHFSRGLAILRMADKKRSLSGSLYWLQVASLQPLIKKESKGYSVIA